MADHEIAEPISIRMGEPSIHYIDAVRIARQNQTGGTVDSYPVITDDGNGVQARSTTLNLVSDLHTAIRSATYEEETQDCSICLETFKNRDDITDLGCHHTYHYDCISQWLNTRETCPICRGTDL